MAISIAIDVMGGDHGAAVTVPAALNLLRRHPELSVSLVGQARVIDAALEQYRKPVDSARVQVQDAGEVVDMDEAPKSALRNKKDSSMRVAINLVGEGAANATVSAGNTGALMATARFVLRTLPGIARPAIVTTLPRMNSHVHLLDLGANIDSRPEWLLQFGAMGTILVKYLENNPNPTVALLNIGVEENKGTKTVREAAALFRDSGLNYQGFIEGDAIYTGNVDVVVCDGFLGNIALKTSEGLAQMITGILREEFRRNFSTRVAGVLSLPVIRSLKRRVDHRRYNGATLIGLRGTVIKSHGNADIIAFEHAIEEAIAEVNNRVPEHIGNELNTLLSTALE